MTELMDLAHQMLNPTLKVVDLRCEVVVFETRRDCSQ